jgi:hypothetical protein
MLERHGQRDPAFNCTSPKAPTGDPCRDTDSYDRGPKFPEALVAKVSPTIAAIQVEWEHGDLQSLALHFKPEVTREAIERAFAVAAGPERHSNVMSADIQGGSSLLLQMQGFDHMGAGDVECAP